MYRITQIATTCEVSPQAIRQYLIRSGLINKAVKEGRAIIIPDEVADEVLHHYKKDYNNVVNDTTTNNNQIVEILSKELNDLREQISIKDEQIRALNKTVEVLADSNKALAASNAVKDITENKKLLLEDEQIQEQQKSKWKRIKEIITE